MELEQAGQDSVVVGSLGAAGDETHYKSPFKELAENTRNYSMFMKEI